MRRTSILTTVLAAREPAPDCSKISGTAAPAAGDGY
jgi:hypothetical protein